EPVHDDGRTETAGVDHGGIGAAEAPEVDRTLEEEPLGIGARADLDATAIGGRGHGISQGRVGGRAVTAGLDLVDQAVAVVVGAVFDLGTGRLADRGAGVGGGLVVGD